MITIFEPITAVIPQDSIPGRTLFNVYTSDFQQTPSTNISRCSDDITIYAENRDTEAISET